MFIFMKNEMAAEKNLKQSQMRGFKGEEKRRDSKRDNKGSIP